MRTSFQRAAVVAVTVSPNVGVMGRIFLVLVNCWALNAGGTIRQVPLRRAKMQVR